MRLLMDQFKDDYVHGTKYYLGSCGKRRTNKFPFTDRDMRVAVVRYAKSSKTAKARVTKYRKNYSLAAPSRENRSGLCGYTFLLARPSKKSPFVLPPQVMRHGRPSQRTCNAKKSRRCGKICLTLKRNCRK